MKRRLKALIIFLIISGSSCSRFTSNDFLAVKKTDICVYVATASGIMATVVALTLKNNCAVQYVDYSEFRSHLDELGKILDIPIYS